MPTILDQYGNPLQREVLSDPQTSRIAQLQNAYLQSSVDGLTPARAARILRDADNGDILAQHQLFDDMEDRDSHIQGEMSKRKLALIGLDWDIVPPRDASSLEKAAAEWVREILLDVVDDFEDLLLALMDGIGHGFAPVELEWSRMGQEWIPAFHPRPQTWFRLSSDRRELRLNDGSADGAAPIPFGWIMHAHRKAKTGYLGRLGLFRPLVWPFLYRAYSVGDFAEFLETYGLPIIVGKYFSGATPDEKASLFRAVSSLGHDARAIMPADMELEIQSVTGSGNGTPHMGMTEWAEKAISKLLLGATLTSGADGKSSTHALGNVHNEVRKDILAADARQVAATLTRDLVYPLVALNRGGIDALRRCPRLVFDTGEAEDLSLYAEALPKLAGVMQIPAQWAHDKLRIPQPKDGEAVLQMAAPPMLPAGGEGGQAAATAALKAGDGGGPAPDAIDDLAAALAGDWREVVEPLADPIQAALDESHAAGETAGQFLARLPGLLERMPADQLAERLARAAFAARLMGEAGMEIDGGD